MDYFKFLPVEIAIDILSRLPTESVLDCKLVCRNWRSHVRHPSFSKIHSSNAVDSGMLGFLALTQIANSENCFYYFEYDENHESIQRIRRINLTSLFRHFRFVSSCNGLICFARGPSVCICNPITREEVMLPQVKSRYCNLRQYRDWAIGFGHVSSTDEYKIVGIYASDAMFVQVYIYTLGSGNGWRKLGKFNFESSKHWGQGVFADGALYWLDNRLQMIITFDLAVERFCGNLSPPPLPQDGHWRHDNRIGVLGGFLSFAVYLGAEGVIWLLKKKNEYHDMEEQEEHPSMVWSKEFRIDNGELFSVTKGERVLTYVEDYLNVYETKTSTSKAVVEFNSWLRQVSPHQNTLVSLKELGEEDTKVMESIGIEEMKNREQLQEDANPEYIYL